MATRKEIEKSLQQLRKIEAHREVGAEKAIRKIYRTALKDLKQFVGYEYAELAQDGKLTYAILQKKGEFARFLQEVEQRLDGITPAIGAEITKLVEDTYKLSYEGMVEAVSKSRNPQELQDALQGLRGVTPEEIKAAVENPIAGLTLKDTLEKNRREIVYDIKRTIGVALANGDRAETMAKRISKSLDGDYNKALRIARTESHRVREAGLHNASKDLDDTIKQGVSGNRMVKIWRTMQDKRVRDTHAPVDGKVLLMDEMFKLPSGAETDCPSNSGVASEDINCRCYLSYKLMNDKEYYAATGKHFPSYKGFEYGETDTRDSAGNDSLAKYTDANGKLTPEREKLHREIIDKHFEGIEKPDGQPIFTVMGGGSAAGKSTMIKDGAATIPKGSVMVDSDAIKGMLPEYNDFIKAGRMDVAAAYVHEESSALAKRILGIANEGGYNVALDGTGDGSIGSLTKKIMSARKAGLRVEGIYATVPTEVAISRSMARAKQTGRMVPDVVIKQTHTKVSQILPECAELFDDVRLFDTTDGAKLIAKGGNGKKLKAVKGKEKEFEAFLDKAKQ